LVNRIAKRRFGADRIALMRGRRRIFHDRFGTNNTDGIDSCPPASGLVVGVGLSVLEKRGALLADDPPLLGLANFVFRTAHAAVSCHRALLRFYMRIA
jgi:hypothetical protein